MTELIFESKLMDPPITVLLINTLHSYMCCYFDSVCMIMAPVFNIVAWWYTLMLVKQLYMVVWQTTEINWIWILKTQLNFPALKQNKTTASLFFLYFFSGTASTQARNQRMLLDASFPCKLDIQSIPKSYSFDLLSISHVSLFLIIYSTTVLISHSSILVHSNITVS